ncbi:MAG: pyridoxal phosphate-dependent aminotransferase [Muribaculaceae bacterium]|nr:pyridoxal phosphate-dependent aminotransferase [Muribaculaceae bacterium]
MSQNQFNFDELVNRVNTNSLKWDAASDGVLPMWVADMDFNVAPAIVEALRKRLNHAVFGYVHLPDSYYRSIIDWFARRHNWHIEPEWIKYIGGVVPALTVCVKAFTNPGDKVLIQTPVYTCFFSSIVNNGCEIEESRLLYENNTYSIDFEDLERRAADPKVKLMIVCNPHNPACRVWTREELERMAEICIKNNVTIVSDEIHCELTKPGTSYVPMGVLSEEVQNHSVTCCSPTKAFNIAGLQVSNIVCKNAEMRAKIERAIEVNELGGVNPFGVEALQAAYNEGEQWLDELRQYIWDNYIFLRDYINTNIPKLKVCELEGTYLAWVDCKALNIKSDDLVKMLVEKGKVMPNPGTMYGEAGEGFIRINMACPRSQLAIGLERIANVVNNL